MFSTVLNLKVGPPIISENVGPRMEIIVVQAQILWCEHFNNTILC